MFDLKLTLADITPDQAWALAQLVKRISFQELLSNSAGEDEAWAMRLAVSKLQDALADAGYAPR